MDPHATSDSSPRDLSKLLGRLESKLLSSGSSDIEIRRLRHSSLERNKVNANVEHARALLFRLEHDSPQSRGAAITAKQNDRQVDLHDKRILIKRLQQRLDDLAHEQDVNNDSSDYTDSSDDEDLLSTYAPAISDLSTGIDTKVSDGPTIRTQDAQAAAAAATLSSTLRSRKAGANGNLSPDTAVTSGSRSAGPAATLGNITPFSPAPDKKASDLASTTQLLESHDSEQNAITDSLLSLASALKQSTLSFSDSIDSSNPLVDIAAQALDKNVTGMEAAGQRMGALRKMTEGAGWWGRLNLFVRVGILWVVAILIGLVLPKLRF